MVARLQVLPARDTAVEGGCDGRAARVWARPRTTGGGAAAAALRPAQAADVELAGESRDDDSEPRDERSESEPPSRDAAALLAGGGAGKPRPRRSRPRSSIHGRSSCKVDS